MKKTILLTSTLFLIMLFFGLNAQTAFNNYNFSLSYYATGEIKHTTNSPINVNTNSNFGSQANVPRVIDRYDSVYSRVCIVDFHDPSFIVSKIHIKIGTLKDSSDVHNYSFFYNDSLNVPEGTEYYTYNNKIYLGLFETIMTDMYYYKVWLESVTGELSEPKYYF